ncbi:MAG: hypothetical protein J6Z46_07220 [Lachnospiraceae bacterium]|nr:hypothetical protein [Lachnospiraceae bacterium]MBP5249778.1 hypothetical protein [Lachnospiraceae bacterium]
MKKEKKKHVPTLKHNMDCASCQKSFTPYYEGTMELKAEHEISKHIMNCRECKDEFEAFFMFSSAFKMLNSDDPANMIYDINKYIAKKEERYKNYIRQKTTILVEIVLIGLIVGAFIVFLFYEDFWGLM